MYIFVKVICTFQFRNHVFHDFGLEKDIVFSEYCFVFLRWMCLTEYILYNFHDCWIRIVYVIILEYCKAWRLHLSGHVLCDLDLLMKSVTLTLLWKAVILGQMVEEVNVIVTLFLSKYDTNLFQWWKQPWYSKPI